jgi:hypothetical protein
MATLHVDHVSLPHLIDMQSDYSEDFRATTLALEDMIDTAV